MYERNFMDWLFRLLLLSWLTVTTKLKISTQRSKMLVAAVAQDGLLWDPCIAPVALSMPQLDNFATLNSTNMPTCFAISAQLTLLT